ncbi:MAG TPA: PspA/IM30 family protein [Candidatus Saccharimonadales bacterium]|jgi:phage shock protein A|nr:PspA/IM30 family protein [Candidatus Saccharimonadales bacterium]
MSLLERVSTLIRANLNDLVEKAEHPEKMIKQVILDMENQLLQVKTQVAIALADQHLLEKKLKENEERIAEWGRKAELAVAKKQDDLARAAIERSLQYKGLATSLGQQAADQRGQAETLKTVLRELQHKLAETRAKSEALIAQHRRARIASKAAEAQAKAGDPIHASTFDRLKTKVMHTEAMGEATGHVAKTESIEDRLAQLEKEDEVNRILSELKSAHKGA